MENYKNKYLKYKNKYLKLKGGFPCPPSIPIFPESPELGTFNTYNHAASQEELYGDICPICQSAIIQDGAVNNVIKLYPCCHVLHAACYRELVSAQQRHLAIRNECPTCKTRLLGRRELFRWDLDISTRTWIWPQTITAQDYIDADLVIQ